MNRFKLLIKKLLFYFINTVEKQRDVVLTGFSQGIQNVDFEGKNAVPDKCNFSGRIKVGYATTLGVNNILHGDILIGKYCQLGANVSVHTNNHPLEFMSMYINKNLLNGEIRNLRVRNTVTIGNDVWIGHGVIIVGNVSIGNGAVLGAGSVVTKDVKPYTIVAGVPAKRIRKRFSDTIIKEIEELKWWDKNEKELEELKPLFFKNFVNKDSIHD